MIAGSCSDDSKDIQEAPKSCTLSNIQTSSNKETKYVINSEGQLDRVEQHALGNLVSQTFYHWSGSGNLDSIVFRSTTYVIEEQSHNKRVIKRYNADTLLSWSEQTMHGEGFDTSMVYNYDRSKLFAKVIVRTVSGNLVERNSEYLPDSNGNFQERHSESYLYDETPNPYLVDPIYDILFDPKRSKNHMLSSDLTRTYSDLGYILTEADSSEKITFIYRCE